MTQRSKAFENLVTTIERTLLPKGAIVKSPNFLEDKVTGKMREVDATIEFMLGTQKVIIAIECRDHGRKQNVLWIEQLATKSRDIGVHRTIAVSSSAFNKQAMAKAEAHNIELRTVKEVSQSEIESWIQAVIITMLDYHYVIESCSIQFYEEIKEPLVLDESIQKAFKENPYYGTVFFQANTDSGRNIDSLFNHWLTCIKDTFLTDYKEGVHYSIPLNANFRPGSYYTLTKKGPRFIKTIILKLNMIISSKSLQPSSVYSYSSPDGASLQVAEYDAADCNMSFFIQQTSKGLTKKDA